MLQFPSSPYDQTILILFGAAGSGKSKMSRKLQENVLSVPIISTGDLLRIRAQEEDELGLQLSASIKQGRLAEDDIIIDLLAKRTKQQDCQFGFILDGFPRTKAQAELFLDALPSADRLNKGQEFGQTLLNIEVGEPTVTCIAFELQADLEKVVTNGLRRNRGEEDTREILTQRFENYHKKTRPVLPLLEQRGIPVHSINVNGSVTQGAVQIIKKLILV